MTIKFNPNRKIDLKELKQIIEILEKTFPESKSIEAFTKANYYEDSTKHGDLYDLVVHISENTSQSVHDQSYFTGSWSNMDLMRSDYKTQDFKDNKHFITYGILTMQYIEYEDKKYFQIV